MNCPFLVAKRDTFLKRFPIPIGMTVIHNLSKLEVVTRDQVERAWQDSETANAKMAIFDDHGVFPLTYGNPQLLYINVLGMLNYFSGSNQAPQRGPMVTFHGKRYIPERLIPPFEDKLGISFKRHKTDLRLTKESCEYARLFKEMGFFTNETPDPDHYETKAKKGSSLPEYIARIIENFEDLPETSKIITRRIVQDMFAAAFWSKARWGRNVGVDLYLLSQPEEDLIENQSQQLIKALGIAYPHMNTGEVSSHFKSHERNGEPRYEGFIYLPLNELMKTGNKYTPRLVNKSHTNEKLEVLIDPSFSIEHHNRKK